MSLTQSEIASVVLAQVPEARRTHSVVYLDQRIRLPGSEIEIDYKKLRLDGPTEIGFVDLEPEMNWGHSCRYVLVNTETGEHQNIDAHFPPFLRETSSSLIVLFKGDKVPDWAVRKSTHAKQL
jgi:hypothetical protein